MIFLVFSLFLKVSKLQKSRKHKENHNLRKSNCFFFFLFGKKFRAGDGRLAGWPGSWPGWLGWQAGWLELAGRLGRGAGLEASWLVLAGGWPGWQAGLPDCLLAPERFILHKKRGKKEERFILHKW